MRKRKPWKFIFILLFAVAISLGIYVYQQQYEPADLFVKVGEGILDNAPEIFSGEPKEVRELRTQEVADTDTQRLRQEYYFGQRKKKNMTMVLTRRRSSLNMLLILWRVLLRVDRNWWCLLQN